LVIGQERGWDLERMARWSVAAGTVSAMEAGTAVAGREKAQSLAEQVEVRRLTV
jgi:fructose-1-phosphate kinase PfkB-like protein